jgi:polysaccharide export outer membrane protein
MRAIRTLIRLRRHLAAAAGTAAVSVAMLSAQTPASVATPANPSAPAQTTSAAASNQANTSGSINAPTPPPADYVIGPEDVLTVVFWKDKDISGDVVVRPDGKISLPLINEIQAAGLTPEQLRQNVLKGASKFFTDEPTVSVTVKQINSRKVYILGSVAKPGPYPLLEKMNVLQLISQAGGLNEFADRKHIRVIHAEKRPDGANWQAEINYDDILKGINLKQIVELKPGDIVMVK